MLSLYLLRRYALKCAAFLLPIRFVKPVYLDFEIVIFLLKLSDKVFNCLLALMRKI